MQKILGMKRSFNCDDLSSIVDNSNQKPDTVPHEDDGEKINFSYRSKKRSRVYSDGCAMYSDCCSCEPERTSYNNPAPPKSSPPDDCLISPVASHVVVSPELSPYHYMAGNERCDFPSILLLKPRPSSKNCDLPATDALQRFMLDENGNDTDFSHWDEVRSADGELCDESSLSSSSHQTRGDAGCAPSSPRRVENFPWPTPRTSLIKQDKCLPSGINISREPITSRNLNPSTNDLPGSFIFMPPTFPTKVGKLNTNQEGKPLMRHIPTVNQITEAIAML